MIKKNFDWASKINYLKNNLPKRIKTIDTIRRIDCIKDWVADIDKGIKGPVDKNSWDLVGHAAIIINEDHDQTKDLLFLLAEIYKINFIALSYDEFEDALAENQSLLEVSPSIFYLEPGEWMKKINKDNLSDETEKKYYDFQVKLKSIIKDFNPFKPVIFVTSVEEMKEINPELREVGLFDRRFEIIPPTLSEKGEDFIQLIGVNYCSKEFLNEYGKIGKLIDSSFYDFRRQNLIALALKRISIKEKRLIEFVDLVNLAIRGSTESDFFPEDPQLLKIVAAHEAGHAAIAVIDSNGEDIPDYATAFPAKSYNGVVSESYAFNYSKYGRLSYLDFQHKIRVSLAGRAAEHIMFGNENVTVRSASSDLEKATMLCREMFACSGISLDMGNPDNYGDNLAIILSPAIPYEDERVFNLTQIYLQKQYQSVIKMLEENLDLFKSIMQSLMQKRILSQTEIYSLISDN